MNIYWQITIIESLQNVAVFAVAVIAFGLVRQAATRLRPHSAHFCDAMVGALFGAATAAAVLLPVHVGGGGSTGSETVLLTLAGFLMGPLAALIALPLAVVAQFLSFQGGTSLDYLGLAMSLSASVAGIGFRLLIIKGLRRQGVSYLDFPVLGVLCAGIGLGLLWLFQGRAAMLDSAAAAILARMAAITALGTLLLHEKRRHEADADLRESEARLAVQARELAAARDAAERANEAKSAFLANMSHELRTPLNAILGFSEIMEAQSFGPLGSSRYREYASDIHASGEHLLSLINDLLDVAKIEAGKMEIEPHEIDTRGAIEGALRLITAKVREKRQTLEISVLPGTPPLYVDERAFKQILINVVSNAVKFTPEGGRISIHAMSYGDNGVQIICEDNGRGIAPDKLAKIFAPFSQIDNRFDREEGGTGLGLSLVRGLVQLHGGKVWLESEAGKGCRAYIVLPPAPSGLLSSVVA